VNGCGCFLFIIYPGAYVDLNDERVQMISAYRQLRCFENFVKLKLNIYFKEFIVLVFFIIWFWLPSL
jgi:S2P endopeptidase